MQDKKVFCVAIFISTTVGPRSSVTFEIIRTRAREILISASVNIPDIIELYIPQKDQTFRASVRWRHKEEVGLSFSQAATNSAAQQSSELTQRVTQLESEIASLRGLLRRPKAKVGSGRDFDAA